MVGPGLDQVTLTKDPVGFNSGTCCSDSVDQLCQTRCKCSRADGHGPDLLRRLQVLLLAQQNDQFLATSSKDQTVQPERS